MNLKIFIFILIKKTMAQKESKTKMNEVFDELKQMDRFNKKNKLCLMKLLVDTSTSMQTYGNTQYNSVKEFLDNKKNEENDFDNLFSLITFNKLVTKHQNWNNFKNINYSIEELRKILYPYGSTRLIDTAYEELLEIEYFINKNKNKYNKIIGVFALQTDGFDNQSVKYTSEELKQKIKDVEKLGIMCVFLASNQDAINTGNEYGFKSQNSLELSATNSVNAYRSLSQVTSRYSENEDNYSGFTPVEREISLGPNNSSQSQNSQNSSNPQTTPIPPPPQTFLGRTYTFNGNNF